MKHAGAAALDRLEPMLERLRGIDGLTEKSRGVFYRKGRAVLHFHEDPTGLHADLRLAGDDFDRFKVGSADEQDDLIRRIEAALPLRA